MLPPPTVCSDVVPISRLDHQLRQSPQDLVLFGNSLTDMLGLSFTNQGPSHLLKLKTESIKLSHLPSEGETFGTLPSLLLFLGLLMSPQLEEGHFRI